jgi:hypothetical protein
MFKIDMEQLEKDFMQQAMLREKEVDQIIEDININGTEKTIEKLTFFLTEEITKFFNIGKGQRALKNMVTNIVHEYVIKEIKND